MNIRRCRAILTTTILLLVALFSVGQLKPPTSAHSEQRKSDSDAQKGERLFQIQCARCHHAPEQLPPRITGTVLRHMRVRALLSQEDERALMKYLAP